MRTYVRVGLALLMALALSTPVFAQTQTDRVSFNTAVGPSFANLGTTWSTLAGLNVDVHDRAAVVGEFGILPHAPFKSDLDVTSPLAAGGFTGSHVNAKHWNGNLKFEPFETERLTPYLTAGVGAFQTDALVREGTIGTTSVQDRRRATDFATNIGAGFLYRLNDWMGVTADYRSFFVHRDDDTPSVNRFTAGLALTLE